MNELGNEQVKPWVDNFIARNNELEEIYEIIQPLLYALSVKLYGDDHQPKNLATLVSDGCALINKE